MVLGARTAIAAAVDEFFNRVTLLLPGDGTNGAQNNTFLDSSTNNFTITRNGNTTQGTFSPFSQTGWSNYFDGSGDYLTVPDSTAFTLGTGDFTIEYWAYVPAYSDMRSYGQVNSVPDGNTISVFGGINGSNKGYCGARVGTTEYACISTGNFPINQWVHHVLVRDGTTLRQYINGVQDGTSTIGTATVNDSANLFAIGRVGEYNALYWNGYISNFRLVKGTCLYPSGTTFTPPTSPLTAITNTQFLTCQSNRFIDNSSNNFTITRNGDVSVQAFSPFAPTAAYSASTNGGSGYFDGTGDYLSVASSSSLNPSGVSYTVDFWMYPTSYPNANCMVFEVGNASTGDMQCLLLNTGKIRFQIGGSAGSEANITLNQWQYITCVKSGANFTVYVNAVAGTTVSLTPNSKTTMFVGAQTAGANPFAGYLCGFRTVSGSANVPSSVPTTPPSPTGSALCLNFTNAGITDATAKNDLETVGNAQISTTQSKFGGSSMSFDGTTDCLFEPSNLNYGYGAGDFTIEFWLRLNSTATQTIVSNLSSAAGTQPHIYYKTGPTGEGIKYFTSNAERIDGGILSINQWYHIAVCKASGTTRMFINGTQAGSSYTDANNYGTSNPLCVGDYVVSGVPTGSATLNGFIDDLRITKYARYTANFTAPTAAFPLQ
jgi:hypothetical protein